MGAVGHQVRARDAAAIMFSASSAIELAAFLTWFGSLGISGLPGTIYIRPGTLACRH